MFLGAMRDHFDWKLLLLLVVVSLYELRAVLPTNMVARLCVVDPTRTFGAFASEEA